MRKPISISELLAKSKPTLDRLKAGGEAADRVFCAVQQLLPAELAAAVWSATLDSEGLLTLVTDSGGWAARLQYLTPSLSSKLAVELAQPVTRTVIGVRPRPQTSHTHSGR